MARRKIIVGNWKMNLNAQQASLLVHRLHERIRIHREIEVVLAPSLLHLQPMSLQIDRRKFRLAAQNAYFKDEGAFTGEVSMPMLSGLVHYVIVGHSERRLIFGESLDTVRQKVAAAFRSGIVPIVCVGETQSERLAGETNQVLHDQVSTALSDLTAEEVGQIVIAYEPVWAIGSGSPATADQANMAARSIRHQIKELYGASTAETARIIYGGSSNSENARAFLDASDIDGLLPGKASLNYHEFSGMVQAAYRSLHGLEVC